MQIISTVMEHWEEAKHFIALQDVKFNRKQYPKTHCNIIDHCKMRGSKRVLFLEENFHDKKVKMSLC